MKTCRSVSNPRHQDGVAIPRTRRVGAGIGTPLRCFLLPLLLALGLDRGPVCRPSPPVDGSGSASREAALRFGSEIDMPNPLERARIEQRLEAQRARRAARMMSDSAPSLGEGIELFGKSGEDRVLVILVEFAGTNTYTWTPGVSTWDPLGLCDNSEFDGVNVANSAASRFFADKHGLVGPTDFTYQGPLHNQIPRPAGTNDPSATMIWMPDFSTSYYSNVIFGDGVVLDFVRQDGTVVDEDFTGMSVRDYYEDLSGGAYTISGTVLGWVQVPHSIWHYGADGLPGARSCTQRPEHHGAIPGAGDARSLVVDALESAKTAYPGFDWASFDQNGDGILDRLWIIHAGMGEEDHPRLLNRTGYGEGGIWSHSWTLALAHPIVPGVSALSYIMMPENAGIAVLAHEFGHNLGAIDLYTYGEGQTSAGFWTLMADSWTGFPLGFRPGALDPMHLDQWGWLRPLLVTDPRQVYTARIGQASRFPSAPDLVRGVKIELPDIPLSPPVQPHSPQRYGFTHNYYLQWRNTGASGGYDAALGDTRFRFGPANTGLLVWYQNNRYWDNSIADYLHDPPSFGPKGKLLVVDAHPEPDFDPYWLERGVSTERGIVFSRGSMRDAPFSRWPTTTYELEPPFSLESAAFAGRPAVPQFSDGRGYYPGIEQLDANLWGTRHWDASAVLPSTEPYGVLGPGCPAGTPLQTVIATRSFVGTNELIAYRTNLFASGLSLAGGDGTPGSVGGDYGWNVRIVHQTDSWAEVVIWNVRHGPSDDDGDGMPNWAEAVAGTDPGNADSLLRMSRVSCAASDRSLELEWPSATNRTYRVLRSVSLQAAFTTVAASLPATPPLNTFHDLTPGSWPEVFYRIEVE